MEVWFYSHLCHIDNAHSKGLVAQDSPVLISLSPLEHDLQAVSISLQEVGILQRDRDNKN